MVQHSLPARATSRRGFTITELLVVLALTTLLMSILSQAFTSGLESFRQLKGIGDLSERLRAASIALREDVIAAHFETNDFIGDTLQTGTPDRSQAGALQLRYEAIFADASELEPQLREVERQTTNLIARRILDRSLDVLAGVKLGAAITVKILELINPPDPPDRDL